MFHRHSSELHISHRHLVFTNNNKISYNKVYPSAKINYEGQVDNFIHIKKKLGFLLSPVLPDPLCRSWVTMMGLHKLVCTQPLPRLLVSGDPNSMEKQIRTSSNDCCWKVNDSSELSSPPLQYDGTHLYPITLHGDIENWELILPNSWLSKAEKHRAKFRSATNSLTWNFLPYTRSEFCQHWSIIMIVSFIVF